MIVSTNRIAVNVQPSSEDVLRWADGTWCYRHELSEMSHMSDDYETLYVGIPEYFFFLHG